MAISSDLFGFTSLICKSWMHLIFPAIAAMDASAVADPANDLLLLPKDDIYSGLKMLHRLSISPHDLSSFCSRAHLNVQMPENKILT